LLLLLVARIVQNCVLNFVVGNCCVDAANFTLERVCWLGTSARYSQAIWYVCVRGALPKILLFVLGEYLVHNPIFCDDGINRESL
jgi:hypothetical protein